MAFLNEQGLDQAFIEIGNRLKKKANSSDVNTSVANINTELGKKANKADVSAALAGKADKTYVDAELGKKANSSDVTSKLNEKISSSEKGKADGVATLGKDGLILSSQLPSYVDDVIEGYYYNNAFYKDFSEIKVTGVPATVTNNQLVYQDNSSAIKSKYQIIFNNIITPERGKIYVCKPLDRTNITILVGSNYNNDSICYRYTGSAYVPISDVPEKIINDIAELRNNVTNLNDNVRDLVSITWSALKSLRDNGKLVAGRQYRITDYNCTTTQTNTQSAGHQFDIIVVADSSNKLNEVARAIRHTNDSALADAEDGKAYFDNSKLEAWKIWYCLDNDTNRFAWADATNGKGVIYRMIDEFNNDCPYDFKNIQFKRWKIIKANRSALVGTYLATTNIQTTIIIDANDFIWCYTFFYGKDSSISSSNVYANIIKPKINANHAIINDIVFLGEECINNSFGNDCINNSFGNNCSNSSFGNNCRSNIFGNDFIGNSFGDGCRGNIFGNSCSNNSFGNSCSNNSFGSNCGSNIFGNNCFSNSFGSNCFSNSFGSDCDSNIFGNNCFSNSFGNSCRNNSFGNNCISNSFGNSCSNNTMGDYNSSNKFENNMQYVEFSGKGTSDKIIQNYHIKQGMTFTSSTKHTITAKTGLNYELTVAKQSDGTVVEYCEADLLKAIGRTFVTNSAETLD